MRRGVICFLTLCLAVCLAAVTAPAAQATDNAHVHCVCGGHANGVGDHVCGEAVTWEPWDGTGEMVDGHSYYLNDTDGDGVIALTAPLTIEGKVVNLCLNGVELTSGDRVLLVKGVKSSSDPILSGLSICDCQPRDQWGSVTSTGKGIAPVLHSYTADRGDVTINLYSGHLVAKDGDATTDSDAGTLRLGNNIKASGDAANHLGTFNLYCGTISGGSTLKSGGNVFVSVDCQFNMYGGSITGGQATGSGGNLYVAGCLNMQGGVISGGSAGNLGGGVFISANNDHASTMILGGTAQIIDNQGSNLYIPAGGTVTLGALTAPARIGVTPVNTTGFIKTSNPDDASYFFSDNGKNNVVWSEGSLKLGHIHCVCGGSAVGVADHACEDTNWTALSAALKAKGMTVQTADFAKLDAGHYFLDCDVTALTSNTNITKDISLCLNGYSISRETGKIFPYLKNGATLNICDCSGVQAADGSWSWEGSICGGTNTYGSVIYTHYGSVLNVYGGNLTGQGSNVGVIVVANDGCADLNEDGTVNDADKALAEPAVMHFYNGAITGSQVATKHSTIDSFHTAQVYWYGGTIHGGKLSGQQEIAVLMEGDCLADGGFTTLAAAVKKAKDGKYIRLISDVQDTATVSGTVAVDLRGHDLSGITVTGTLNAFDTAAVKGVLTCTGNPASQYASYVAVPNQGGYSFYRFQAQINEVSIKPSTAAVGYRAQYDAEPVLQQMIQGFGYQLWLKEDMKITRQIGAAYFTPGRELTLRLNNVLKTDNDFVTNFNNTKAQIYAQAFIRLEDGTVATSDTRSFNLQQMLELADPYYETFSDSQKSALGTLYSTYEDLMLGWDLPNTGHADGSWTPLDAQAFLGTLSYYGTYSLNAVQVPEYRIKAGKYVLTEDVDLTDSMTLENAAVTPTIRIHRGDTVTICLNGHTIRSDSRVFKVYGELNICDCCKTDGAVTSSFTGNNNAYAPVAYVYNGTMNLHSGELEATGQVTAAGVLAVGKSGTVTGTLNVFGGSIHGGNVSNNSGLIAVYDAASMNMYDGKLYGGTSQGTSAGVFAGSGSKVKLYGGEICGNTAATQGGGLYIGDGQTHTYLGDRLVIRDNTAMYGGNIYNHSTVMIPMDGVHVYDGSAAAGGGIYTIGAGMSLTGSCEIRDNENGSLYLTHDMVLDTQGLTRGADVHVYNRSVMELSAPLSQYVTLERSGYNTVNYGGQLVLMPQSFTVPSTVEGFQVGFGRADITPTEIGMPLAGYGNAATRLSKSIDKNAPLTVTTVAVTDEAGQTVLLMSADLIRPSKALMDTILPAVSAATGVPVGNIFTTFTHTHSVPETNQTNDPTIIRYNAMLPDQFASSANLAMADRAAATMETGSFEVDGLNFTRHYQHTDANGVVKYFGDNFGTQVLDTTTRHVTDADHTMHLVKFDRAGTDILMANWRVHPHMTGGSAKYVVSSDIIGTTQKAFEEKSGMHFIYLQGAAGNINETTRIDSEKHGLDYIEYGDELSDQMIKALLGGALKSTQTGLWQVDNYSYTATSDKSSDAEYQHALAAREAYNAWLEKNPSATSAQKRVKCEELGYLTWFHFNNVITRHGLYDTYQLPLNTFSLGSSLAFFTAPGELWDTVSMEIEEYSKFPMTMCIGYSQDHFNYFVYDPDNSGAMTYESYESNNYRFVAPTTIKEMIAYWKQALDTLYANVGD